MAFSESFETKPEARKFYSQSKVSRLKSRFPLLKQRLCLLVEKLKIIRHDHTTFPIKSFNLSFDVPHCVFRRFYYISEIEEVL